MKKWHIIVALSLGAAFFVILPAIAKGVFLRGASPVIEIQKDKIGNQKELPKFIEHQVIVKFKPSKINQKTMLGQQQATNFVKSKKLESLELNRTSNFAVVQDKSKSAVSLIDELKNDPNVESVQPNYQYYLRSVDPDYTKLWGLHNSGQTVNGISGTAGADIKAPEAWNITTGNDFTVAIIDTGVAYNHPDLQLSMWDGTSCVDANNQPLDECNYGYDFEDNDKIPLPTSSSHGTHIAGIIAAQKDNSIGVVGVAPHAKIMALKVSLTTADEIQAIQFAQNNGAKIINASWGGPSYDPLLKSAIDSFSGLFITAAGNAAVDHNVVTNDYPCNYDSPNIICVAATDQNDYLADFSDYGTKDVDVGAPGSNIYSTWAATDVLNESFDEVTPPDIPTGYLKTGDWGTYNLGGWWGNVMYGDVSHYPYLPNANSTLTSPVVDLSNATGATISFMAACDTEYSPTSWTDYMSLETKVSEVVEAPPTLTIQWGGRGTDDGKFTIPRGIAVDSHGDLFVADALNHRVQKFSITGKFLMKFGYNGAGDGGFLNESGIVIDRNDNIFVLDPNRYRVQKFLSDGTYVTQFGSQGTSDGQFDSPTDLTVDSDGNVYVIQQGVNARIQKFDNSGNFLLRWGSYGSGDGQLGGSIGIAASPDGKIYAADTGNNRVQVFSNTGQFLSKVAIGSPGKIQFDPQGFVYITAFNGSQNITKYNPSNWQISFSILGPAYSQGLVIDKRGNVFIEDTNNDLVKKYIFQEIAPTNDSSFGSFSYAYDAARDNLGNVFVTDYQGNNVYKYDSSGSLVTSWGSFGTANGQFNLPTGISIDPSGNVFVADYGNNRIQKFTNSGTFITAWGGYGSGDGKFNGPIDVAVNIVGTVYVVDRSNVRIQSFSNSGSYGGTWGTYGSGNGQFQYPRGIVTDGFGYVYVTDDGRNNIQKFNSGGSFMSMWGSVGHGDDQFASPSNIAVDSEDNIYVVSSTDGIKKYSSTGVFITRWQTPGSPTRGVVVGEDNNKVYVVDSSNTVWVYSQSLQHIGPVPAPYFGTINRWDEASLSDGVEVPGSAVGYLTNRIPAVSFSNDYQFQFRWISNGNGNFGGGDGCFVKDITISKFNDGSLAQYEFSDGTSMATPYVVGEAALLWSIKPDLSSAVIKDVILNSGDVESSLQGKTATGKRINLFGAVKELSKAKFSNLPANISNLASVNINVGGHDVNSYRYSVDGASYSSETLVANPIVLTGLSDGDHIIRVIGKGNTNYWQAESEATTYSWKVDTAAPTATISYSTTAITNQDVVATLNPSEPVTVTNNGGSLTWTFSENGSFTFTFADTAGNIGSATATVSNIDKTPPPPPPAPEPVPPTPSIPVPEPIPVPAPAPTPTPIPIPAPKVLGAEIIKPIITNVNLVKGEYKLWVGKKLVSIKPFDKSYKGKIWAKKVNFGGTQGSVYVFAPLEKFPKGEIRLYDKNGKLIQSLKPFGGFSTYGFNLSMILEPLNNKVYLAVGTTKAGTTVKTYRLTDKKLTAVNSLTATVKSGNVLVSFQKLYKTQYGLVTMKQGDRKTLKVWKLDLTKNKFMEDKKINKTKIKI